MVKSLSAIELLYLAKELVLLDGSRLDSFSQVSDSHFQIGFFISSRGKLYLDIILPSLCYLSESKVRVDAKIGGIGAHLDKMLSGKRLNHVRQVGYERILEFDLRDNFKLYLELFSKGNILLVGPEGKILALHHKESWASRTLDIEVEYKMPKSNSIDFKELLKETDSIGKTLAVNLGLGKLFSDELLFRCNIPRTIPTISLSPNQIQDIEYKLAELKQYNPKGYAFFENDILKDISPIPLSQFESIEIKPYESFSKVLEEHSQNPIYEFKVKEKREKWKIIVEEQEKNLIQVEQESTDLKQKGELIYLNYPAISGILADIKHLRKDHSWEQIKELYSNHPIIKEIHSEKGKIVLEFQ